MNADNIIIDALDAEPQQGGYHSPTPWAFRQEGDDALVIVDANGNDTTILADLQHEPGVGIFGDPEGAHKDIRHIVACVNFCAGFSAAYIEKLTAAGGLEVIEIGAKEAFAERDELLFTLRKIRMLILEANKAIEAIKAIPQTNQ